MTSIFSCLLNSTCWGFKTVCKQLGNLETGSDLKSLCLWSKQESFLFSECHKQKGQGFQPTGILFCNSDIMECLTFCGWHKGKLQPGSFFQYSASKLFHCCTDNTKVNFFCWTLRWNSKRTMYCLSTPTTLQLGCINTPLEPSVIYVRICRPSSYKFCLTKSGIRSWLRLCCFSKCREVSCDDLSGGLQPNTQPAPLFFVQTQRHWPKLPLCSLQHRGKL